MKTPLDTPMGNGATTCDWLGTAATAAGVAKQHIETVRSYTDDTKRLHRLAGAEACLEQALTEVRAVRHRWAEFNAYGK